KTDVLDVPERLEDAFKDGFKEQTILIYLALHGGGNDRDGAYLVPGDFKVYPGPKDKKGSDALLRVRDVLDLLKQWPKKNKVLILDATQVVADWPLGLLHNNFARKLDDLKDEIAEIPRLVVLSASGKDQRSWVSEEWGRTIFGHYVIEGLKGAADKSGNGNNRVDVREFVEYVEKEVPAWVQANRDEKQTPQLYLGKDLRREDLSQIELVALEKSYQAPDPTDARGARWASPPALRNAWEKWDALRRQTPAPAVYTPHLWRQYQDLLVRYEQLLRAPAEWAQEEAGGVARQLARLEESIEAARKAPSLPNAVRAALPMPVVLGQMSLSDVKLTEYARALWKEPNS